MLILEILKAKEGWYMDKETYRVLASVRIERAIELVEEAPKCNHTLYIKPKELHEFWEDATENNPKEQN